MQISNPASDVASAETHSCVECGQHFPKSELMAFNNFYVCPECKPSAVEKIKRGEPVGSMWRDGKRLVVICDSPMPDRCVRCNKPAEGYRVKRQVYWHPSGIYLFVLLSPIIYALVAAVVRKKSKAHVGLCPSHRRRRYLRILTCAGLMIVGGAGAVCSLAYINKTTLSGSLAGVSIFLFLGGMVGAVVVSRVVEVYRITRTHAFLKGVDESFLQTLPDWPGL